MMNIVQIRRNGSTGWFAVHYKVRLDPGFDVEPQDIIIDDVFDSGDCEIGGLLSQDALADIAVKICEEIDEGVTYEY